VQGNGNGIPATTAACVDAETLAAWVDDGLAKADAAAVEMHLAECERCTAMVATFARTIPDAPVAESLWTRWHLRWLVPLATAATVAAVWVLVPRTDSPQITTLGRGPTTESQAAAAADAAQPAATTESKEQQARTAPSPTKPADALAKREESSQALRQSTDERRADADQAAKRLQAAPLNEAIAVAPPPAQEADRAEAKSADPQGRFSPPIPSANAVPPAAPAPAARTSATAPAAEESARRAPAAAPSPAAAALPAAAPQPATLGAAPSTQARAVVPRAREGAAIVEIASPDPMIRWRVVGAGQVERTTNGGARWEAAKLPESATLIAGSSPSPSICWLVGRTGSIYVTTDGLRFVRVPFQDRTDFVSIQATDGRRATVVTIDGRTMRTDDQGANWIRISP
jgi:Putative zinc-finger